MPGLRIQISIVIYLTGFKPVLNRLGLELGPRIWITIIKFYWIWTWKYLGWDIGLRLI